MLTKSPEDYYKWDYIWVSAITICLKSVFGSLFSTAYPLPRQLTGNHRYTVQEGVLPLEGKSPVDF